MWRRLVQWREEQFARVDDDFKHVEPVQHGLDCLSIEDGTTDPFSALRRYVDSNLRASESFFDHGSLEKAAISENVLTFPSPIQTEDDCNNTLYGRLYEARRRQRAVVVIPHWNSQAASYRRLCWSLARAGITTLQINLPYHDERAPLGERVARKMVSSNLGRTIRSSRQAVLEARLAIDWLEQQGYLKIGLVGVSLGSSIASIVAAHDQRVRACAFVLMANDFAEVVWTGRATRHIRRSLDGQLDLAQLQEVWSIISPATYARKPHLKKTPILVLSGRHDTVFQPVLTRKIIEIYQAAGVQYTWRTFPCGHYTMATLPFSGWMLGMVASFIRRHV